MVYRLVIVFSAATVALWWFAQTEEAFDKDRVKGRNVVITGASSGIGEELAYQYAKLGANVFITARRENLLQKVIDKCKSINSKGKFGYYVSDMSQYKTESRPFIQKAVEAFNGIDTLIVNHAHLSKMPVWHGAEEELELFEMVSDVNFKSYVHVASHALPYLKSSKSGRLGITASIGGKIPVVQASIYCGARFALDGFFSTLRDELAQAKTNVSVTLAFLGLVETEAGAKAMEELGMEGFAMNPNWIVDAATLIRAKTDETAEQIIKATESGKGELYYPYWFASRILTYPSSWLPIARHIWSTLTEIMVLSKDFYTSQDPAN